MKIGNVYGHQTYLKNRQKLVQGNNITQVEGGLHSAEFRLPETKSQEQ